MSTHRSLFDRLALALALSFATLGCGLFAPALPTTAVETAALPPATGIASPILATPTLEQTQAAESTLVPDATAPATIAALNGYAWDDHTPFAAGLTADEQAVLTTLPGASVYHLAIAIDPSLTRVSGHLSVHYTNQEEVALPEIAFRLYPNLLGGRLDIARLNVDGTFVTPKYAQRDTVLWVGLPAPLAPGASIVVDMDFDVTVPTELDRNYGVLAATDGVLALAHFYPFAAVYDDEGWNIELAPEQGDVLYGDASFFVVQVQASVDLVLAGGGTVIDEAGAPGLQTVTYALGPARDFYLAASEAYVATTGAAGATAIRVYAPAAFAGAAQETVEAAAAALAVFAARYGLYPYTELDLVATPTSALGIEYPGIIALTNNLLDPATTEATVLEAVTVHEVGHQWFYNLVGNDQLDDPWLDESLTQYATLQYYSDTGGAEAAFGFRESLKGRWARLGFAEIRIGLPVADYGGAEYGAIVYGRGPLFFEALADTLGQPAFDVFIADYSRTYRWGIATPQGLKTLAEEACFCELDELFATWGAE